MLLLRQSRVYGADSSWSGSIPSSVVKKRTALEFTVRPLEGDGCVFVWSQGGSGSGPDRALKRLNEPGGLASR